MPWSLLGPGPGFVGQVATRVHVIPSHTHVSLRSSTVHASNPPYRTTFPLWRSATSPKPMRPLNGTGCCGCHALPFHEDMALSHVPGTRPMRIGRLLVGSN